MIGIGLLCALAAALGCILAQRVPDEMKSLEKPLRILQAIAGLALLFVLPWWLALLIAGTLAIGWFPMVAAIGLLCASGEGAVIAVGLPLAILAGARWVLDKRSSLLFCGSVLVAAAFFLVARHFGALTLLG